MIPTRDIVVIHNPVKVTKITFENGQTFFPQGFYGPHKMYNVVFHFALPTVLTGLDTSYIFVSDEVFLQSSTLDLWPLIQYLQYNLFIH